MTPRFDVAIVGAGHAGAQAAIALRKMGFAGTIALIGDEVAPPYERPPLSKDYLSGLVGFDRILIRPVSFWADRGIALLLGRRVRAVDPEARTLEVGGGSGSSVEIVGYDTLIWAAGGAPRTLARAGGDLAGVHAIRTLDDANQLADEMPAARHVVVIGGGYIGLEAAAVLAKLGKHVTVVEALDRVLARVAGEPLSRFYEAEHRAHGVDIRLDATVDHIAGVDGRVANVQLGDGTVLSADIVIVGIGIVPAVEPLISAGAEGRDGVAVDAFCRTSLSNVYAIGDCALHWNVFASDNPVRLESVQNANDQANTAAKAITGNQEAYAAVPWFWSNQYDLKLQTVGLSRGFDELVVRGVPASRSFSVVYLKRGRVLALDCVNNTRDYVQGKALVTGRVAPDRAALADPSVPLRDLAAAVLARA